MEILMKFSTIIYTVGSTVMLPVLMAALGLIIGLSAELSVRGAVKMAAALFGVTLIVNRLGAELVSFAQQFTARWGLASNITCNNYQVASALAFATNMALYILPLSVLVNLLLLLTHSCRTINIDLWSYWHMALTGVMVQTLTGNMLYGFIAAVLHCTLALLFADMMSARVEKASGIPGATMTHGFITAYAPIVWAVNRIFDIVVPKGRSIDFAYIKKRIGILGEPALWCAVLAAAISALAGYTVYGVLQFAMIFAALALLLPLLGRLFGEGFSAAAQRLSQKLNSGKRKGRISIGFSVSLGLFDPTVLFVSLLLIPAALWAGALPIFDFVPAEDVTMLVYIVAAAVAFSGGRILRSLVSAAVSIGVTLLSCGYLAPLLTRMAQDMDSARFAEAGIINTVAGGGSPLTCLEVFFAAYGAAGFALLLVFTVTMAVVNRNRIAAEHRLYLAEKGDTVYPIAGDLGHLSHSVSKKSELKRKAKAAVEGKPEALPEEPEPEKKPKKEAETVQQ